MATGTIKTSLERTNQVDITSQCSISTGTIQSVRYLTAGRLTAIWVQVDGIAFSGTNIWLKLPDSFPANAGVFAPLATAFNGMVCVFRSQSGISGKYLLIQCSTQGTLNLTASGVCLNV